MSKIEVIIETDNAAFEDAGFELSRIFMKIAQDLEPMHGRSLVAVQKALDGASIRDVNGNRCGIVLVEI